MVDIAASKRKRNKYVWKCCLFFTPRKREFNQVGQLADASMLLLEKGFTVDAWVSRKKDKIVAQIKSISNTSVILSIEEGDLAGTVQVSHSSFHKGEWKLSKAPVQKVNLDQLELYASSTNTEFLKKICTGNICAKLLDVETSHSDALSSLKLALKPRRNVVASKKFAKGKLVLVPTTAKIESKDVSETPSNNSICIGRCGTESTVYHLNAHFASPVDKDVGDAFVSPFWLVSTTHVQEEANMHMSLTVGPSDKNSTLKIPTMVNLCAVNPEDVLLRYVPKPAKPDVEAVVPVNTNPPAKRLTAKGSQGSTA